MSADLALQNRSRSPLPIEYLVTEQDAIAYVNHCLIASACLIAGYISTVAGWMPMWGLWAIVWIALPRWVINFHELMHVYTAEQMNRFICVMGVSPIPLSVLTLSYGELRSLHLAHHRSPATDNDPDAFHIRGPLWHVLLNSLTGPEQRTIRWIINQGLSWSLGIDLSLKTLIFAALVWLGGGMTFFGFWLCLRLVYTVSDLSFFRWVHYRDGAYGSFAIHLPAWIEHLATWIWGRTVVYATLNHDIHHLNPCIAVQQLPTARRQFFCDQE